MREVLGSTQGCKSAQYVKTVYAPQIVVNARNHWDNENLNLSTDLKLLLRKTIKDSKLLSELFFNFFVPSLLISRNCQVSLFQVNQ